MIPPSPGTSRGLLIRSAAAGLALLLAWVPGAPTSNAAAQPDGAPERRRIALLDEQLFFGCREVEGTYVALLKPGLGALVLSVSPFHGSELVGAIRGESVAFSVPGTRMPEIQAKSALVSPLEAPLFGRLYQDLELPNEALCIGFDRRHLPTAADLELDLRRTIEDVARDLPASSMRDRSFFISDRLIELEIAVGDLPAIPFTAEEGTRTPLTVAGVGESTALLTLVEPSREPAVLVKIVGSDGAASGPGPFTRIAGELVAIGGVGPPMRLRLIRIGE